MLGIKKAVEIYNNNPIDPFVALSSEGLPNIEIRFSEDGMITAAYLVDIVDGNPVADRWKSDEFRQYLAATSGRRLIGDLLEKEVQHRPEIKPQGPRKAKRSRLNPHFDL